ncbi:magnesium transporter CorA family protein [Legionella gresilensis]|uniref:magnesium transporter CorA family protein n=1 Tax=Legionella gresilensis TaxID=91823 RepID=UPI001041A81D|nr:magnesium transporter CorA family protein [Legionella gresilensis]
MIIAYLYDNHFKPEIINAQNLSCLNDAVWIDLITPTKEEEHWVEKALAVGIPTQEEMREIELTSRLYMENDVLFMTALMIAQSSTLNPKCDPVTFALTPNQLITIRYIEPQSFQMLTNSLAKNNKKYRPSDILIALLEATVDRLADALEYIGQHLDEYSNYVFQPEYNGEKKPNPDYQRIMQNIGSKSNLTAKVRESLINFNRLIVFFRQSTDTQIDKESKVRLINLMKDLESLSDYANFISNKINFLLDATLGMISIEQSAIIKIFSVAAVIFLPPTLIASIYGMNFKFMPELSFKWGYELAILLMLISAWIPYKYFKHKGWL